MDCNYLSISPAIVGHADNMSSCLTQYSIKEYYRPGIDGALYCGGEIVGVISSDPALLRVIMRVVAHGLVYFKDPLAIKRLKELMTHWGSCKRSAYQAIHKQNLIGNDIKVYCKRNYMSLLNQRYVADAVKEASKVEHEHALFGGKKLWKRFLSGSISKKKWLQVRNNTLYSRGDRTQKGNPNIRIVGNQLWINIPSSRGLWLKGKLWVNKPVNQTCYDARVQLKGGKFHVTFSWDTPEPQKITDKSRGVIGIDTNPNGLAMSEINGSGNLQSHVFLKNDRIQFASRGKRDWDIKQMSIKAVEIARQAGKSLVLEQLQFKNRKKSKKFNRMAHNFIYRKLIEAIKSRAVKMGVEVLKVSAAYTSIVGKLKYQKIYSLSIHNAAAMVIGRLGFLPKSDKVVVSVSDKGRVLNLEGRCTTVSLKKQSLLWFKSKFRVCTRDIGLARNKPLLTGACLVPG